MKEREEVIIKYARAWEKKDFKGVQECFAPNIDIKEYFAYEINYDADGLKKNIENLPVKDNANINFIHFVHQGPITVADWQLTCKDNGEDKKYDGLSLFKFNNDNLIVEIREHATETNAD